MSNTIRTRKAPALIEDTGITWSAQCSRLAKTAALAIVLSSLAACGVESSQSVADMAASQPMSIPAYNSKEDCETAAKASGNTIDLNFSCDSVDTTQLGSIDAPTTSTAQATSTTPSHTSSGGTNPLMWYMLGSMMNNRSGVASSGFAPSSVPAPSAFINSSGNGKMSMGSTAQFAAPTPSQYAGLKANGGVVKTGIIGSNLAKAASYKASTSSIGAKSSAGSSMSHSSGGGGGGGG